MGATTVRLDDAFINSAKIAAQASKRSVSKQVEYWGKIGRIAEANRDLPYSVIENILKANAEVDAGEYTRCQE